MPHGFAGNRNVSSAKPELPPSNMLPKDQMIGSDPPVHRGNSEATTSLGDDSTPHRYKGGKEWGGKLKAYTHGATFESLDLD